MAAELGKRLLCEGIIDAVVCFAPSCQVVDGFQRTFIEVIGKPFDGQINAAGMAVTYQSLEYRDESFWRLFDDLRVLAVFDEIHHCSGGSSVQGPNIWGQKIIQRIQDAANFTLALSGTPWRSDFGSIALARYSTPEGHLIVDYCYSLTDAVKEKVCRVPNITLLDHLKVGLKGSAGVLKTYQDFAALLKKSDATFETLVTNPDINRKLLKLAQTRLNSVRESTPDAAGLVVATNISHAHQIAEYLVEMGEVGKVVTTHRPDASSLINEFRVSSERWIIAVGMISEGTDIPRLSVCCYLSRVRTEMYFRQVLGRVLRHRSVGDDQAWMFMLAEPELKQFSERLLEDLPGHLASGEHLQQVPFDADGYQSPQPPNSSLSMVALANIDEKPTKGANSLLPGTRSGVACQLVLDGNFRERLLAFF
ncbi:MAG: diguanylate cyclase [Oceanospirillaceae bacterium]|nr:diguanylate cyclase [Oceanospirillaceae bacterium]